MAASPRLKRLALAALLAPGLARAETCRFAGTGSHSARIAASTQVSEAGGLLTVDAAVSVQASAWFTQVTYLEEEISTWRGGQLQSVAVNARTVVGGKAKRQQWDMFVRDGSALRGQRVQATGLPDFERMHPAFARHWTPAAFGQPWLQDYKAAGPVRRPDLDLPAIPIGLRTPLAATFYWSRFLPDAPGRVPVFLPGFKRDARAELVAGPAVAGPGWRRWDVQMLHPALERSTVSASVSPDHYLQRVELDVHARAGSGQAQLVAEGCQGVTIAP